jgi:hemerythrin
MEIWAEQQAASSTCNRGGQGGDVQFLCVCVESLAVAQQFAKMFHFQYAINSYIPSRSYFPRGYGQLGCSGFIIADAYGNFVSRKTRAYLQYGEHAFAHVEQLLNEKRELHRAATETQQGGGGAGGHAAAATATATADIKHNETPATATSTAPTATTTTTSIKDYYSPPPSVGVDAMDDEHTACAAALKELYKRRTRAALERVIQELESHFAHEEGLMVSSGFGGNGNSKFSALNSHVQDHYRILQIGQDELQRIALVEQESSCNSLSTTA